MLDHPHSASLLAGLTDPQRRAVTTDASVVCILAGAGAGKTRVLTRRIAHRVAVGTADPSRVLALTFTRKAAGELGDRLRQLGLRERVTAGTFHAVAAAQLRRWWSDRGQPAPVLLDRKSRLLGPLVAARPGLAGVGVAEVAGIIEWAKARLVAPGEIGPTAAAARRPLPAEAFELDAVYQRYEHEKTRRGLVDFDDLLGRCADAIRHDPVFAAAQRWRWRHVFVDELQDVNPLQYRLLEAWAGPTPDLCVVGDPNQAIYGWNGADPGLLDTFPERWPGVEVVRLDANHRCSPQIVTAASAVLGPAGAGLTSTAPDGPPVEITAWPSDAAEASGVAAALGQGHRDGRAWSSLAVLTRTNAQALLLGDACRRVGVPVRVPGSAALLDHPAARRALDELRRRPAAPVRAVAWDLEQWAAAAAGEGHPVADGEASEDRRVEDRRVEGRPVEGRPVEGRPVEGRPVEGRPVEGRSFEGRLPGARRVGPGGDDPDAEVLAALAELARHAERLDEGMTVGAWLDWLPVTLGGEDAGGRDESVTVCSFHRAKGLEWRSVWVCGLEAGLVPIGRAATPAALAEERRLLYVALTRAGSELHCSWARTRTFGKGTVRREPSPWLALLTPAPVGDGGTGAAAGADPRAEVTPEEGRRRWLAQRDLLRSGGAAAGGSPGRSGGRSGGQSGGRGSSSLGGRLPASWPPPDEAVLAALRDWRASAARAAAVPAHVVLHDTTMLALASLRPVDEAALLRIPGLGPVKANRYGPTLLALVAQRAA